MKEKETRGVQVYKSTLLNKYFDKYEDLVEAEEKYEAENSEKIRLAKERKEEAEQINSAIKMRVQLEREASAKKKEAYEVYLKALEEADAEVDKARRQEKELLEEWCKKHPEGFHTTITIDDASYEYSYGKTRYIEPFTRLISWFK